MFYFDMDGTLAKFMFGTPVENLYEKGYWLFLPPQLNIVNAAKELDSYILSAYLTEDAVREKKAWNRIWLPNIPEEKQIYVPCGESKGNYYVPDGILIDDRGVHCKEWADAGGTYVKVSVDTDDARKEKKKHKFVIHPEMPSEMIVNILKEAEKEKKWKR